MRIAMHMTDRLIRFRLPKSPEHVERALRFLVRDACENVPYYRRLMDEAGVTPSDIRACSDLSRLPVTTKDALLRAPLGDRLRRGTDPRDCRKRYTSGSTGIAYTVCMNRLELVFRQAALLRAFGHHLPLFLPLRICEVGAGPVGLRERGALSRKLATRLGSLAALSVVHISRCLPLPEQVRVLRDVRPQLVTGHPSCLELVASELLRDGGQQVRPRLVVSRGEVLTSLARQTIGGAFGSPVVDYYSCEEIGNIAWQCRASRGVMHINTDTCVLEIVDQDGQSLPPGAEGRVVVTSLFNCTMPFIRYDLGDRGVLLEASPEDCTCRRGGLSMALPQGRDQDFLVLPGGRQVSPRQADAVVGWAIYNSLGDGSFVQGIVKYQIVQEEVDLVRIRVAVLGSPVAGLISALEEGVRGLDPALRCQVEFVENLPLEPSGKRRAILSRVTESARSVQ